ncbi:MAG: hypothetical protein EOP54_08785 [Sphingobacteriales bacterium]|nr:MAG: hypothetical protein EOP54_08785 [Sphingobacteriales bacterium]
MAVVLGLGFTACQKDYSPTPGIELPDPQNPLSGTFSCLVDGQQFKAEAKTYSYDADTKTLVMQGTKYAENRAPGAYQQIMITIPNYDGGKRYNVTGAANITYIVINEQGSVATYNALSNENYYVQTEGNYKGAFNVVVANASNNTERVILSEGKFDFE